MIIFELWRNLVRLIPTVRLDILVPIQIAVTGLMVYSFIQFAFYTHGRVAANWILTTLICFLALKFSFYLCESREGDWDELDQRNANEFARYCERREEKSRIREEKRRGLRY